jgi:hypothetical protein
MLRPMRTLLTSLVLAMTVSACSSAAATPDLQISTAPMTDVEIGATGVPFGFRVCAPRDLHHCIGTAGVRGETRLWPAVDIARNTSCATQAADVTARCGDPMVPGTQPCFAAGGMLLDQGSSGVAQPVTADATFVLQCAEGQASIQFMVPF